MGANNSVPIDEETAKAQYICLVNQENGLYLGLNDQRELTLQQDTHGDSLLWKQDGKCLKNWTGGVLEMTEGEEGNVKEIVKQNSISKI